MRTLTRRGALGLGVAGAAAAGLAGCGALKSSDGPNPSGGSADRKPAGSKPGSKPESKPSAKPIGDGSTSYTGKQPKQPAKPEPLEPGQKPPQFVVFSWDGAGEVGNGLFPRFLDL
ncbi:hypothetical protein NC490_62715, partial [Streptomyces sp. G1]|nr:hypothetical protein [Streptomyces sp. G1]